MATGTVQFQSGTLASPPVGLAVMADAVNDSTLGAGTVQYIKIMDGATGGTQKAGVGANGLAVDVTRVQGTVQTLGSVQGVGTFQVLGSIQSVGTTQVLGSVQAVGTVQIQGTVRSVVSSLTGENFFGTLWTAGQTNGTLVPAPAQGTYVRVFDLIVSGSAAGTAFIEFGDGTAFGAGVFAANGGYVFNSMRGVRTHGTSQDILFNATSGTWGVSVNYSLET